MISGRAAQDDAKAPAYSDARKAIVVKRDEEVVYCAGGADECRTTIS